MELQSGAGIVALYMISKYNTFIPVAQVLTLWRPAAFGDFCFSGNLAPSGNPDSKTYAQNKNC